MLILHNVFAISFTPFTNIFCVWIWLKHLLRQKIDLQFKCLKFAKSHGSASSNCHATQCAKSPDWRKWIALMSVNRASVCVFSVEIWFWRKFQWHSHYIIITVPQSGGKSNKKTDSRNETLLWDFIWCTVVLHEQYHIIWWICINTILPNEKWIKELKRRRTFQPNCARYNNVNLQQIIKTLECPNLCHK